jgi:hypothetical protein
MLHLSARSLRIALFAAALLTAAAAPAAAQDPAADVAPDQPVQSIAPGNQNQGGLKGEDKDGKDKKDSGDGKGSDGRDSGHGGGKKDDGKKDDGKKDDGKGYGDKKDGDRRDGDKRDHDRRDGDKKDDKGRFGKRDRAKLDYKLRVGHHRASKKSHSRPSSEAEGRFSVERWKVSHQGWARDRGKGFTVVTFKHLRRGHDDIKVEVFKVDDGRVWTAFKRDGRFDKLSVTVCKVVPSHHRKVAHGCKTRIFSKGWH